MTLGSERTRSHSRTGIEFTNVPPVSLPVNSNLTEIASNLDQQQWWLLDSSRRRRGRYVRQESPSSGDLEPLLASTVGAGATGAAAGAAGAAAAAAAGSPEVLGAGSSGGDPLKGGASPSSPRSRCPELSGLSLPVWSRSGQSAIK